MAGTYKGTLEALLATVIDGEQGALNVNVVAQGAQPTPMGAYKGTPEALLATVVDGEMGAINVNVLSGGGGGELKKAILIITDDQIKHLLGTPLTLVTPAPGTAIVPLAMWAICDFRNGAYTDPDFNLNSGDTEIDGISLGNQTYFGSFAISDDGLIPPPGAALFYMYMNAKASNGSIPYQPEALIYHKPESTQEFTGGGAGNTLKIIMWYLEPPTT